MAVSGWKEVRGRLEKSFDFADFAEALAFVNKVGELAERLDHHPDICIKNYKYVSVSTTTHDEGGLTDRDRKLASEIDHLL
jgi:4a-hydroxytetrahydrobiopterin dehydratase